MRKEIHTNIKMEVLFHLRLKHNNSWNQTKNKLIRKTEWNPIIDMKWINAPPALFSVVWESVGRTLHRSELQTHTKTEQNKHLQNQNKTQMVLWSKIWSVLLLITYARHENLQEPHFAWRILSGKERGKIRLWWKTKQK